MRIYSMAMGILVALSLLATYATADSPLSFLPPPILSILRRPNTLNSPSSVSNALTGARTSTKQPTAAQIRYYFYYAYSTYCSDELKELNCGYCQKFRDDVDSHTVLTDDDYDTLALITVSRLREEIIISFRGTIINLWNILLDANFFNTAVDNIQIHSGFYKAAMSLYEKVVTTVRNELTKNRKFKIVITGHSLGGAMARLTLFFLLKSNRFPGAIYELYTYGEPRVGNKPFAEFFNRQNITTARTVNKGDVVAHLPPTGVLGTEILYSYYIHPLTEFWIKSDTIQFFCNQSFYEDPRCSDSLTLSYSVIDHSNYFNVSTITCAVINSVDATQNLPELSESKGILSSVLSGVSSLVGVVSGVTMKLIQ